MDEACGEGKHCNETTFECEAGCTEICEEGKTLRCTVDGLEECTPNDNGCAQWNVKDACAGGSCDSTTLTCVKNCENACTEGQKRCEGTGIASCTKDGNGCFVWGAAAACESGKSCDSSSITCETVCNSNCSEKDKKETHATSQRVCTDVNGKGCLQWVETKCKKGEKFDTKQNKCVSVCGDDCAPFAIVFLPDPQKNLRKLKKDSNGNIVKSDGAPDIFPDMLKWIHDYKDKYNIKAVIHLGDITDTNAKIAWQHVNNSYVKYIDKLDLPYTVAPGNHDYLQCPNNDVGKLSDACKGEDGNIYKRSGTKFHKEAAGNFNQNRPTVSKRKWFAEYKADTTAKTGNSFITFKAANIDFLVIALEFLPRDSVINWADKVISNHPNHKVIIETHGYLYPGSYEHCTQPPAMNAAGQFTGKYTGTNDQFGDNINGGKELFDKLIAKHNNVILAVNGHHSGSCFRLNKGNSGNIIGEMVVDYQSEDGIGGACRSTNDNGGSGTGWFRMLTFDPKNYTITAKTTSSLAGSRFKKGQEWFYCTHKDSNPDKATYKYPADPTKKPSYKLGMDKTEHRYTNHHAFVVDFDFVTPVDYVKK